MRLTCGGQQLDASGSKVWQDRDGEDGEGLDERTQAGVEGAGEGDDLRVMGALRTAAADVGGEGCNLEECVTRHTSHVTHHTSYVKGHTSHVTWQHDCRKANTGPPATASAAHLRRQCLYIFATVRAAAAASALDGTSGSSCCHAGATTAAMCGQAARSFCFSPCRYMEDSSLTRA